MGPDNSHMEDLNLPLTNQWMYHAVSSVILAHNILRADPRVDSDRIGICGISWGGVIASVTIGYDGRFRFAIPIYSSGYLGCGHTDLTGIFRRPGAQLWFAERRFPEVRIPVMWLCWNDDWCFSINSNSMSYMDTKDANPDTCLSMRHEMKHSHQFGYNPEESYWYAGRILNGEPIPRVDVQYKDGSLKYSCTAEVRSIRLFYISGKMSFGEREKYGRKDVFMVYDWKTLALDPEAHEAKLPEDAVGKYVEFTLPGGVVLTSPYCE